MNEIQEHCKDCLNDFDERIEMILLEWRRDGGIYYCPRCGKEFPYKVEENIESKDSK